MSRAEQMGKIRERLIRKRDEVFEAHRLGDEARLILSEHDIEPEETAQKGAIADVLAILDEKEQKDFQAINRALARMELGSMAHVRSVEKESRRSALRQFHGRVLSDSEGHLRRGLLKGEGGDRDAVKWFESFEREAGLSCNVGTVLPEG